MHKFDSFKENCFISKKLFFYVIVIFMDCHQLLDTAKILKLFIYIFIKIVYFSVKSSRIVVEIFSGSEIKFLNLRPFQKLMTIKQTFDN